MTSVSIFSLAQQRILKTAAAPAVAFHPGSREYVVVYAGRDLVNGEDVDGIFSTRLSETLTLLSPFTSYTIMDGGDAIPRAPDIAAAFGESEGNVGFLVVWDRNGSIEGTHLTHRGMPIAGLVDIVPATASLRNHDPTASYDPSNKHYVVTWQGRGVTEREIFGAIEIPAGMEDDELLAVNDALQRLELRDRVTAELVKLRFFA